MPKYDIADPDLPVLLGALLLAEEGTRQRKSLVRALRPAHAFGPRRDDEECQIASRHLIDGLLEGGDLAVDGEQRLCLTERGGETLAALREAAVPAEDALAGRARNVLADVVDIQQARMFADRTAALVRFLARLEGPGRVGAEARLLQSAFALRLVARLDGPRADRPRLARDCIDFFYTQAVVLRWRERNQGQPRRPTKEDVVWRTVRRGVAAARVEIALRRGPLLIHLLRLDLKKVRLRAVDATRYPVEERDLAHLCRRFGAFEGTSGGFFLYSEEDVTPPQHRGDPVGLLVEDGEVVVPPLFSRAALLVDEKGHVHVRRVSLKGTTVAWGGEGPDGGRIVLRRVNRPRQSASEIVAYSRAWGRETSADSGRTVTIVHRRVVAVGTGATPIPLLGVVLDFPTDPVADGVVASLAPGTAVRWTLPVIPGEGRVVDAMAGGPQLLSRSAVRIDLEGEDFREGVPPVTFSDDATVDQNLLPRLAWGVLSDYRIVAAAVDGRNVERSVGETLDGLARFLREIGCTEAVNFDGGSSKRMCVEGEVVDLSTTALVEGGSPAGPRAPVRPVSSAWLVVPRD